MAQPGEKYQPKGDADPRAELPTKYEAIVKEPVVRAEAGTDAGAAWRA